MPLILHKSLCDMNKAGQLASSGNPNSKAGEQRGGNYFHRVQTGYSKDNTPEYRYFKTKEEWESYQAHENPKSKEPKKKDKDDGAERLKKKTQKEQKASSKKVNKDSGLFIKPSKKDSPKVQKSLYITLEVK